MDHLEYRGGIDFKVRIATSAATAPGMIDRLDRCFCLASSKVLDGSRNGYARFARGEIVLRVVLFLSVVLVDVAIAGDLDSGQSHTSRDVSICEMLANVSKYNGMLVRSMARVEKASFERTYVWHQACEGGLLLRFNVDLPRDASLEFLLNEIDRAWDLSQGGEHYVVVATLIGVVDSRAMRKSYSEATLVVEHATDLKVIKANSIVPKFPETH
jgi:hypothetical protein